MSLAVNATWSPATGWVCASLTFAVAVLVDVPLAMIELGDIATDDVRGGTGRLGQRRLSRHARCDRAVGRGDRDRVSGRGAGDRRGVGPVLVIGDRADLLGGVVGGERDVVARARAGPARRSPLPWRCWSMFRWR